ncbi:hypothetical protein [Calidifontibacter terrae]
MLDQEKLAQLWDFGDPEQSLRRLSAARDATTDASERAELTTQVARALGLMERYADARAELATVTDGAAVVLTRVALEEGRIANSSGDRVLAVPLFHQARANAQQAGLTFLEVDALHMLAIADRNHAEDWAEQGIGLAENGDLLTQRWLISLHNNLGWDHFDAQEFDVARQHFEQAEQWAERVGTPNQREIAREALAECDAAAQGAGRAASSWDDE